MKPPRRAPEVLPPKSPSPRKKRRRPEFAQMIQAALFTQSYLFGQIRTPRSESAMLGCLAKARSRHMSHLPAMLRIALQAGVTGLSVLLRRDLLGRRGQSQVSKLESGRAMIKPI